MKYLIENCGVYEEADIVDALDKDIDIIEVEERTVYIDKENNFSITVDGDGAKNRGFINDPYFKYHKSKSSSKGETVRISFNSQYVVHNNDTEELTSKERKLLDKTMNKMSNMKAYKNLTVWEAIKQAVKDETDYLTDEQEKKIDSIKKPDFKIIKPAK